MKILVLAIMLVTFSAFSVLGGYIASKYDPETYKSHKNGNPNLRLSNFGITILFISLVMAFMSLGGMLTLLFVL